MKLSAKERIEKHFGMTFRQVITNLHFKECKSILSLSRECSVSRDSFNKAALKLGIKFRSQSEAAKNKYNHFPHWAIGLTKENSEWAARNSERMKKNNPGNNEDVRCRMSATLSNSFRKKELPQEKLFRKLLIKHKIKFEAQKAIGRYIIDFFIPKLGLCIEIDSTYRWGNELKRRAAIKDNALNEQGFSVLRINKEFVKNPLKISGILKENKLIK